MVDEHGGRVGPESPAHGGPPGGPRSGIGELSWLEAATILLLRARTILLSGLIVAVVAAGLAALRVRYSAESRFAPETASTDLSRFSGLASQIGINVGGMDTGESLQFYGELVLSSDLLRQAVLSEYPAPAPGGDSAGTTLVDLYDAEGDTRHERLLDAVDELRSNLVVELDQAANLVTVRTTAETRELATAINRRLLELVNAFNLEHRQTKAAAEHAFLKTRVSEAAAELREAERRMEDFLTQNQAFQNSPRLQFQHARIQREVGLQQQIYSELSSALEEARLAEIRNTPVISVVDRPEGSARRAGLRWPVAGVIGLFLGLLVGIVLAFVAEYIARERELDPERYRQLGRAWGTLLRRSPGRHP